MKVRCLVGPVGLVAVLFAGCTSSPSPAPRPGSWVKAGTSLPAGERFIVQDRARDSLWVLTMDPSFEKRAGTLAEVSWSGRVRSQVPLGKILGYIPNTGAGVALDTKGNVWMVWGTTLARYTPKTRDLKTYDVPLPKAAPEIGRTRPDLLGPTSGLAVTGDTVWTAWSGVRALQRFDIPREEWGAEVPIPSRPLRLYATAHGKIIATGRRLIVFDPATERVTRHNLELFDLLPTPSGSVIYEKTSPSGGSLRAFDPDTNSDTALISGVHMSRSWLDEENRLWTIRGEPHAIFVERVDLASKTRVSFRYPGRRMGKEAAEYFCRGLCESPDPDAIYPTNIVTVAASKNRVLVLTDYDDDPRSIYPPIYRLIL